MAPKGKLLGFGDACSMQNNANEGLSVNICSPYTNFWNQAAQFNAALASKAPVHTSFESE
jgi:hypothetical protein